MPNHFSMEGALQCLFFTLLDVCFVISKLSQFIYQPIEKHQRAIKCVLRHLSGTISHGLLHYKTLLTLHVFVDADQAGDLGTHSCTSAYVAFFRVNFINYSLNKQPTVARSSNEVEYHVIVSTTADLNQIQHFLQEFQIPSTLPTIYCDNMRSI